MAARPQAGDQAVAVGARDRLLARRVDGRHDDGVGVVEAGAEGLEQGVQPGVAMRLHHRDHLALGRLAGGLEHRRDLDRVVAVVVDHRDAVPLAGLGEAPLDAAETGERLADQIVGNAELARHRDRGGRVQRVVSPRHRQREPRDGVHVGPGAVAEDDGKARAAIHVIEAGQAHVRLGILAIGDDPPVLDAADQLLHHRMIGAHHRKAVEGHILDEVLERALHRLEGLEVVEMLGVHIGDDRDVGRQLQEGAVGFVRLDHHPVAAPEPRIGAVGVDDAAVDDGGIEVAGFQQRRDQRRGGGLAVGAGDRHAALEPHQLRQHLGAAHDRQALRARRHQLGIVALDRGRHHQHVGAVDILRLVADRDRDALLAQPVDVGAVDDVGSFDRIAEIDQHLGDAAHADAPDADEVDRADVARQLHGELILSLSDQPPAAPARRAGRRRRARPPGGNPAP